VARFSKIGEPRHAVVVGSNDGNFQFVLILDVRNDLKHLQGKSDAVQRGDLMTDSTFDILSLLPKDTPDYMTDAWLGFVLFAAGEVQVCEQFKKDTGLVFKAATSPLDQMIDKATGHDEHLIREFVLWINKTLWGPINEPDGDTSPEEQ
jgi:hypothetical protein